MRSWSIALALAALSSWAIVRFAPDALFDVELALDPPPAMLAMPVAGATPKSLRDSWGAPRDGGARRHEGIDIFARRGTPVKASTRGIVWAVTENRLGGHVVTVLGPGRELHYFAHLDRFADVRPGMRVAEGTVLGFVGNSGNARGGPTHLHYGIYPLGRAAVDPYPRLVAGATSASALARHEHRGTMAN